MSFPRPLRLFAAASLLLVTLVAPGAFAQDGAPGWFQLKDEFQNRWTLTWDPAQPQTAQLAAKDPADGRLFRVMVLFPKKSSAYDTAMAQILSVFDDKKLNTVFHLAHFEGDDAKGDAAVAWARANRQDLIFSMGSRSTAYMLKWRETLDIPVVTVCSKDPVLLGQVADYDSGSDSNMAFTSLDVPIRSQLAYLKQLKNNLSQLAVLYAVNNRSAVATQVEPLVAAAEEQGIVIHRVAVQDQNRAAEELAREVPKMRDAMLASDPKGENSIFWITGSTSVFREINTINRHAGTIPVLSAIPNVVKAGSESAVLSIGVSFENNAQIAGIYGYRILTGQAKTGELPVGVISPPDIAINFMKAIEIDLKIPFSFFESAGFVYDHRGVLVRAKGQNLTP
ncbi:hypothetical protein [Acanthopleuribacter pedis]|uniref:ABC transporter substrate-binding protein n=1 Tax=Acanthopleuribacter pedis TaxID=442870 RepID=A0A8J7U865_9BACT|nr:hypothetical protein [Acanthopleuribacter pedis]MBO1323248.1 hypothetical protein [Acanthopleuribacter pedis]